MDTDWIPAVTTLIGGGLSLYGGQQAASGAIDAGNATLSASQRSAAAYRDAGERQSASEIIKARRAKEADDFAASQYLQNAGQAVAAAQRAALDEGRKARLVASRAVALAAASGAGASDVSVVNLVGRIKGEGAYNAQVHMYQGEEQARQMRMAAKAKQYQGLTAEEAGGLNAADIRAKYEAAATAEEAKGVAASEAGKIQGQAAKIKGATGALPALGTAAGLLSKYGDKVSGLFKDPYGTASAAEMRAAVEADATAFTPEQIAAVEAEEATRLSGSVESTIGEFNDAAYFTDVASAAEGFEVASSFADFEWLALV